jgi:tetratricopeptide (TPR) repeat protein
MVHLRNTGITIVGLLAFMLTGCMNANQVANGISTAAAPLGVRSQPQARQDPVATEALVRAEGLRHQGQLDEALAEFERVIETNPLMTVAYMGAGDIYREQGNFELAERRYGAAARVEPRNFDAQYYHGFALQMLDRFSDAIRAYLRALAIRPNDFDANLNLASSYLELGEPTQSLPYAQRSIALRPDSGPAHANLAAVFAALGRHASAVTEYQQAADLMELGPDLLLNMADSLGYLKRYGEMASTLDQLLRIEPSPAAWERMGKAMFKMRQYDKALDAFNRAIAMDPSYYPAQNGAGVCLLNEYLWSDQQDGRAKQAAVAALRRSLQIEPDQPRILELVRRYGG